MGATSTLDTLRKGVPPELLNRPQWVLWRLVPQPGKPKPRKVPFDAKTGRQADPTDPASWSGFDDCARAFEQGGYSGLGFVFAPHDPYCGIDFDDCVSGGNLDPWVKDWLLELDSYTEYSHSGEGIHVVVRAKLPTGGNRRKIDTGGTRPVGIEMYDKARFFALTGNRVPKTPKPINSRQGALDRLHQAVFGPQAAAGNGGRQNPSTVGGGSANPLLAQRTDQQLIDKLLNHPRKPHFPNLWRGDITGYASRSEAVLALLNDLAWVTGSDRARMDRLFRQSGLMDDKFDEKRGGATWGWQQIERAASDTHNWYNPSYDIALETARQAVNGGGGMGGNTNGTGQSQGGGGNGAAATPGKAPSNGGQGRKAAYHYAPPNPTAGDYLLSLASLGYSFRMNELDNTLEVNGQPITDALEARIRTQMRDLGYGRMKPIEDAYIADALNNTYHPIKDYLKSLQWDGGDHIRALAAHFKDKHTPIVYADGSTETVIYVWLKRWLVGAVAKVFERRAVAGQNGVLVIEGGQGIGKSTFAHWLCSGIPKYFTEAPVDPDNKECHRLLATTWIWEIGELGSTTRRADREALKHFLTQSTVTFRVPYARHPVTKPALASFIGTVNNEGGFLADPTGNRRFLTLSVESLDWSYLQAIDVNQLWAQAYTLYQVGESWRLLPEEEQKQAELNGEFEVEDPYEGWVRQSYEIDLVMGQNKVTGWFIPTVEITQELQNRGVRGDSRQIQMALATTMRRLGLEKTRQYGTRGPRGYWGVRKKP